MEKCLALVLSGGGARGALQVGALRALFELGIKPDLLVGTSIGAVNATGLALWGVNQAGIDGLSHAYQVMAASHFMDPRLDRFALRAISRQSNLRANRQLEGFLISNGCAPNLRFAQISNIRLALIGADLDIGEPVIYGKDAEQSVLEGVLASTALPPWFSPLKKDGHWIMDGGVLSNLPVEPAMIMGATEIIALDLDDPVGMLGIHTAHSEYLEKLVFSIIRRQASLEIALATAKGVPVHYLLLKSSPPSPIWDFSRHLELFQIGYEIASKEIPMWF
jgi:NTE family protein